MHSRLLVSGLPRSLPPIPPSPAPPYLPAVEGRKRAVPHSSSFPLDDYSPAESPHGLRLKLRELFREDLPVLRLHYDRGGEFSSDLLRDFCCGEGILPSFTLLASPQQNRIAERRIGLVMEVALTSMIHAAAPHFLWPFAVRYAAHQLNLWPRVSLLETSPTLRWTGKVGDLFIPCVFPMSSLCLPRPRPPPVPRTHVMALHPSSVPLRVPLRPPPASSLPAVPTLIAELVDFAATCCLDYTTALVAVSKSFCPPSVKGECALGTDVLEDWQEDYECLADAIPHLVAMLLTPEGDPDAPNLPAPRSYAEAITGTYVDAVPHSRANIDDGMWIFRVKRPPGSPPVFKARYVARGFSQRQGVDFFQTFSPTPKMTTLRVLLHVAARFDYELHSLDFNTAFLQGSLHEEIWLRRPPGFTGSFPVGTLWSQSRPVYGLRQAPREWHDTLRMTLTVLGFPPSTSDPSLFLRIDTSHPPFYVLMFVDDLVFATAYTEALALVLQRFGFRYSSPQSTSLPTGHSLSAPPLDESVEPSGPYPELVGYLMWVMTCTRPHLAYPLSILAHYVAPGRHQPEHWEATKRVLSSLYTQTLLGCEAEIYAGGMAAQELLWLTYLLTDFGERPCSSPVLYVDNNAMIALCQEHRTKHIALRYFLARELQHRGELRLAYVAIRANTVDIFTKALQSGDYQPRKFVRPPDPVGILTRERVLDATLVRRFFRRWQCEGSLSLSHTMPDHEQDLLMKVSRECVAVVGP
ncbi:unnamed protein product [Closterium sp. NIES-53]